MHSNNENRFVENKLFIQIIIFIDPRTLAIDEIQMEAWSFLCNNLLSNCDIVHKELQA